MKRFVFAGLAVLLLLFGLIVFGNVFARLSGYMGSPDYIGLGLVLAVSVMATLSLTSAHSDDE